MSGSMAFAEPGRIVKVVAIFCVFLVYILSW